MAPWIAAEQELSPTERDLRRAKMAEALLARCDGRWQGEHFSIVHAEFGCVASEHGGRHMQHAWLILNAGRNVRDGRPAKWKTVEMLHTLRQALRECHVQMMNLEMPDHGASEMAVRGFLTQARALDRVHHGMETF